jgi:hypothetical protein
MGHRARDCQCTRREYGRPGGRGRPGVLALSGSARRRLAVYPLVRELVYGRAARVFGRMADTEGEIGETQAPVEMDRPEDHAKAPGGLGQVDLGAVGQHGAIASFCLDATQVLKGNPTLLVGPPCGLGGLAAGSRGPCKVFLPRVGIEVRGKAARRGARHVLRLAVGREHEWPVLALELSGLLRGQFAPP